MVACGRRRCTLLYVKRLSLQAARGHQHTHTPPRARAPRPSNARERAHPPPKAAALWKTRGQRRRKAPCTYKRGCGDPQHGSAARSGPPPPAELRRGAARRGAARLLLLTVSREKTQRPVVARRETKAAETPCRRRTQRCIHEMCNKKHSHRRLLQIARAPKRTRLSQKNKRNEEALVAIREANQTVNRKPSSLCNKEPPRGRANKSGRHL